MFKQNEIKINNLNVSWACTSWPVSAVDHTPPPTITQPATQEGNGHLPVAYLNKFIRWYSICLFCSGAIMFYGVTLSGQGLHCVGIYTIWLCSIPMRSTRITIDLFFTQYYNNIFQQWSSVLCSYYSLLLHKVQWYCLSNMSRFCQERNWGNRYSKYSVQGGGGGLSL